jgi:hypothetical protein
MAKQTRAALKAQLASLENELDTVIAQARHKQQEGNRIDPANLHGQIAAISERIKSVNQPLVAANPTTNVSIIGIEVTQSIQFWTPPVLPGLTPGQFGTPNTMWLIANKPTVLRVYVDAANNTSTVPVPTTLTGVASCNGLAGMINLTPLNAPITARSASAIQRGQVNHTLNFWIPADHCTPGGVVCNLSVYDPLNPADSDPFDYLILNFGVVANPPVHGIFVHYTGPNFFGAPVDAQPSSWDFASAMDQVIQMFPVSSFEITGYEVMPWSANLSVTQNFNDCLNQVRMLRSMSGSHDIYCAALPPEAGCGGVCGLGGDLCALFFANDAHDAAHEIGHALGRHHTPCHNPSPSPDPNYPAYIGSPQGSIGEFGFDTGNVIVWEPITTFDVMSYCPPYWISPYTYDGLFQFINKRTEYFQDSPDGVRMANTASVWDSRSSEFLHLFFRLYREEEQKPLDVLGAFHLPQRPPPRYPMYPADVVLELRSADGAFIDSYPCGFSDVHSEPGGAFTDFSAVVPWSAEVRRLNVVQAGRTIAGLVPTKQSPTLTITEVTRSKRTPDLLRVRWRGAADAEASPALSFGVRYSHDGGEHWRALALGLTETNYVINLDLLRGGDHCIAQVVASAGLRTTVAQIEPFAVPIKPRKPYLLAPKPDAEFEVGVPITLLGGGYSPDFGVTSFESVIWHCESLEYHHRGHRHIIHGLPEGRHRVTLSIDDGMGQEISQSVEILVRSRGRDTTLEGPSQ